MDYCCIFAAAGTGADMLPNNCKWMQQSCFRGSTLSLIQFIKQNAYSRWISFFKMQIHVQSSHYIAPLACSKISQHIITFLPSFQSIQELYIQFHRYMILFVFIIIICIWPSVSLVQSVQNESTKKKLLTFQKPSFCSQNRRHKKKLPSATFPKI